jgi:hypothetical protein
VYRKHVLGKIVADDCDSHGLPLQSELMRVHTSHRGTLWPVVALRLTRDGEVPLYSLGVTRVLRHPADTFDRTK